MKNIKMVLSTCNNEDEIVCKLQDSFDELKIVDMEKYWYEDSFGEEGECIDIVVEVELTGIGYSLARMLEGLGFQEKF